MTPEEIQAQADLQTKMDGLKSDILKAAKEENEKALKAAIDKATKEANDRIKTLTDELEGQKTKFSDLEIKVKKSEISSISKFIENNNKAIKLMAEMLREKKTAKAYLQISSKAVTDASAIEDGGGAVITRDQTNFGSSMVLAQSPSVERIDDFDVFLNSGVTLVPLTGNATSVPYIDEVTEGDAAVQNPEGNTKAEIDVKYVERVANTKTYAGFTGVSDQMLEDIVMLQMWIFAVLRRKLQVAYNNAFFNGSGLLGSMNGVKNLGTAFDATGLLLGAGAAVGIYEVINAAITQARVNNFNVTRVWMNPIDYYKMLSERSDQGRVNTVVEMQVINGYIGTARIQLTNYVAAGTLILAEAALIKTIYRANKFGMPEIGLNGDDFVNNMQTIRAHARLENVLSENDKGGVIVVSDIDAAITAIAADPVAL